MRQRFGQRGFFMLEIVLTLVILIALAAIVGMFGKPTATGAMAAHNTVAANLAQQVIESLKAEDAAFWRAIDCETELDFSRLSHLVAARQSINKLEYIIEGTAQPHSAQPAGLVIVTITVNYMENGKLHSKPFMAYFTKNSF